MKLQIETVKIEDVLLGHRTYISDHHLHVNLEELEKIILEDKRIKSTQLEWVYPGDRIRIVKNLIILSRFD